MLSRRLYYLFFGLVNAYALSVLLFRVHEQNIINFLSFFTILSNLFATGFFIYFGFQLRKKMPPHINFYYGACTVYMTITGIGYWLLLRNDHTFAGMGLPWLNIMGHGIMPIAVLVGWLLYFHTRQLKSIDTALWLIFPIIYLIYTLLRGHSTGWYPYPFLNPEIVGSYRAVFGYSLFLTAITYIVGWGVVYTGNKLKQSSKK